MSRIALVFALVCAVIAFGLVYFVGYWIST